MSDETAVGLFFLLVLVVWLGCGIYQSSRILARRQAAEREASAKAMPTGTVAASKIGSIDASKIEPGDIAGSKIASVNCSKITGRLLP